ncbi:prefoldin-like protein [Aspergillus stella-maris]|uniref:prefoldin-like protein n=1 Tax=Aspergillus stella-maris TaxID=1810926 RepID=UPI003CCD2928
MGVPSNNIEGLERQRVELESNILQLQQSLYHWRTWEAEYEGLKEDIAELDDDATTTDFLRINRNLGGTLMNDDEFRDIIGEKQGLKRNKSQVVDRLSRRVDYVRDNITSMEKRLRAAEARLEALDSDNGSSEPPFEGPVQDIIEELDEDGEVISGRIERPGDQASDLLDILKKAGVENIPELPKPEASATTESSSAGSTTKTPTLEDHKQNGSSELGRETSSQTNGVSSSPAAEPPAETENEIPIVDVDESPEDAQLRREMLRYGLDEVGAVVAELELADDASDGSFDDGYDYDDEEDEEEDAYGRSTRTVLDEDYHQQMRELEAKLNARGMWNVGKDSTSLPENMQEDLDQPSRVKIERKSEANGEANGESAFKAKQKKKVAFAEELDIAPAPKPPSQEIKEVAPRETEVPVLSDSIVERTQSVEKDSTASAPAPKKTSRFKTARGMAGTIADTNSTASSSGSTQGSKTSERRAAQLGPTPSMPLFPARPAEPKPFSQPITDITEKSPAPAKNNDKILADKLVERDISEGSATAPEPDELDEELHRKEIASEFFQMRSRMAKQNGGSLDEEEPEMVPVQPEEAPKRISKFRAARMG